MPRNRIIKHDFWADEKTGELSFGARLMFIGSWNFADDIGVFRGNFAYLKANIFPYDASVTIKQIDSFCKELVKAGLVINGKFNGENYFLIKNFSKHQKINRPSDFRFISGSDKHNVLELFNSVSAHDILNTYSLTKVKEKEKEKEKENTKSCDLVSEFDFELIYNAYPRKSGKALGMKKLQSMKMNQTLFDRILHGAKNYKNYTSSSGIEERFIKQFSTWVNQECWNDEYITKEQLLKEFDADLIAKLDGGYFNVGE